MNEERLEVDHSNVPEPIKEYIDLQVKLITENFRNELKEFETKMEMYINNTVSEYISILKELNEKKDV